MPLTESQQPTINIERLVIDHPSRVVDNKNRFAPEYYLRPHEVDMLSKGDYLTPLAAPYARQIPRDQKILLGHGWELPKESFIKFEKKVSADQMIGQSENPVLNAATLHCLGYPFSVSSKNIDYSLNLYGPPGIRTYNAVYSLSSLIMIDQLPDELQPEVIHELKKVKYADNNSDTFTGAKVALKLLGQDASISSEDMKSIIKLMERKREMLVLSNFFHIAANLAIVSADEVQFGKKGIELIYHDSTDLNTTPPIPTVRDF